MRREEAFDAVRKANPLPSDATGPDGFLSMTALLERIDERNTDMQTQERIPTSPATPPGPSWRRRLVPAVAAGLAVMVAIVVAVFVVAGGDNEPPRPVGAGEMGEALNVAAAAGDWETVVGLFAEDATVTLGPGTLQFEGRQFTRTSPITFGPGPGAGIGDFLTGDDWLGSFPIVDWDGDSVRNGIDSVAQDTMIGWAMGFSVFESCSAEDASTLVCVGVWDGHPFPNPGRGEEIAIHTVVDGVITDTTWDIEGVTGNGNVLDRIDANDYVSWIEANRSEFTTDTELFREISGDPIRELVMTPDTVEIHRQLIAEWVAQR